MPELLIFLIPVVMIGVVIALFRGFASFAQEGREARERSNRMMQWRLGLQALAMLLLFGVLIFAGS